MGVLRFEVGERSAALADVGIRAHTPTRWLALLQPVAPLLCVGE
ncbi:hypothetical protein [Pseudomonas sp. 8Z]|nr:hypothetical protein [Pseudomonas sp. 8Z]